MHHNYLLAGGMGQVIKRNFLLKVLPTQQHVETAEPVLLNIAGRLCTPQDLLARKVRLATPVQPGDRIVFFNCGAYGLAASPVNFLGHPPPSERLISA